MHTSKKTTSDKTWKNATENERWLTIVTRALVHCGGPARLSTLYELIEGHPKTAGRKHWRAKVRQVLERSEAFVRVEAGVWDFASRYSAEVVAELERQRREHHARGKR